MLHYTGHSVCSGIQLEPKEQRGHFPLVLDSGTCPDLHSFRRSFTQLVALDLLFHLFLLFSLRLIWGEPGRYHSKLCGTQ